MDAQAVGDKSESGCDWPVAGVPSTRRDASELIQNTIRTRRRDGEGPLAALLLASSGPVSDAIATNRLVDKAVIGHQTGKETAPLPNRSWGVTNENSQIRSGSRNPGRWDGGAGSTGMVTGPGPFNAGRSRTLFEQIGGGCRVSWDSPGSQGRRSLVHFILSQHPPTLEEYLQNSRLPCFIPRARTALDRLGASPSRATASHSFSSPGEPPAPVRRRYSPPST